MNRREILTLILFADLSKLINFYFPEIISGAIEVN